MAACKWIDVQFSGREEFRPTLVEHRTAYSVFDCQAFQPRVVLSIGGIEKRRFYRRINLNDAVDGNPGVLLRPVQLATLILDCELHNHSRLDVVQQYLSRGEEVMHSLQANLYRHGPSHKIAQYAFDMYWQLLYPFASTVLLFIDDLGGVGPVIEILALWARRARLSSIAAPPRILVLYHWRNRTEMDSFESRLRSRIMCTVSGTQPYSRTGITSPIYLQGEMAFESVQLIPTWKAASEFPSQTEESFAARDAAGYGFSSDHLKRLLQTAILQYSQSSGQQIDFVQAVRVCNPPPTQLTEKLIQFLSTTKDAEMDHMAVIASALDLDAHPPGMHFFAPQTTFGKTYRAAVSQAESLLNKDGLSDQVCKKFTQFSLERQGVSSAHAHLRLLRKYQATWRDYVEGNLCFVCLVRPPSTTLDCHHRLCDACVMIYGSRTSPDSPSFQVLSCPLCGKHHRRQIFLQPPTSGNRILELGGASKYKWEMLKFLREVQSAIGLPVPLQEHFDLVIGSGIGLFFVQTIFLEGWDLSDCQYHLKNVGDPEVDRKQSLVSFGKNLTWKMGRTANCNGAHLVFIFEGHHSAARHTELRMNLRHREPDFTVRYMGGPYNDLSLKSVTQRMVSCLFYIELLFRPALYSPPEAALVRLLCRLPQGPEMVSLVRGMFQRRTRIRYRGAEATWSTDILVTPTVLARCRSGDSFAKLLEVQVSAMDTVVDVRLDDNLMGEHSISNCPYKVERLVEEQGLDCAFGRRDHQFVNDIGIGSQGLREEIEMVSNTIGRFTLSGECQNSWI